MNDEKTAATLCLFAKSPEPGKVKTRLIPTLGADGSAMLAEQLWLTMLERVQRASISTPINIECRVAGDFNHPFVMSLMQQGMRCIDQGEGDLGQRMAMAVSDAVQQSDPVILLGSDCLGVDVAYIQEAIEKLQKYDVVIGPAEDGGYVLLGMTLRLPELFDDMPWGTTEVFEKTKQRLEQHNVNWYELPQAWDVDEASDLKKIPSSFYSDYLIKS